MVEGIELLYLRDGSQCDLCGEIVSDDLLMLVGVFNTARWKHPSLADTPKGDLEAHDQYVCHICFATTMMLNSQSSAVVADLYILN